MSKFVELDLSTDEYEEIRNIIVEYANISGECNGIIKRIVDSPVTKRDRLMEFIVNSSDYDVYCANRDVVDCIDSKYCSWDMPTFKRNDRKLSMLSDEELEKIVDKLKSKERR